MPSSAQYGNYVSRAPASPCGQQKLKNGTRLTQVLIPLPPHSFPSHASMKSFVWFTTVLLLCIELAHAAHITPVHGHRLHRRVSTKSTGNLRRRGRTCKPPAGSNGTDTDTNQFNAANNGGFPSLGFKMPDSVPSSVDGWWSDYKSEIGFLGFSYAVDACTFLADP